MLVTEVTLSPMSPSHHHTFPPPHRLVSARHIGQNKDYENLQSEKAKSVFTEAALGVRTGKEMFAEFTSSRQAKEGAKVTMTVAATSTGPATEGVSEAATAPVEQTTMVKSEDEEEEVEREEKGSQTDFHEIPTTRAPTTNPITKTPTTRTPATRTPTAKATRAPLHAGAADSVPQLVQNGDLEGVTVPSQPPETSSLQRDPSPEPKPVATRVRRSKREFLECAPICVSG